MHIQQYTVYILYIYSVWNEGHTVLFHETTVFQNVGASKTFRIASQSIDFYVQSSPRVLRGSRSFPRGILKLAYNIYHKKCYHSKHKKEPIKNNDTSFSRNFRLLCFTEKSENSRMNLRMLLRKIKHSNYF